MLTESTDSTVSLAAGEVLVKIWTAVVSNDPPSVPFSSCLEVITRGLASSPSGRIENPEGRIAMLLESHPVIADCIPVYLLHQRRFSFPVFQIILHDAERIDPNVFEAQAHCHKESVL